MRKTYPYLQEQYVYNLNEEQRKRDFLSLLDNFVNQKQYVQITLLDKEESPLKSIEGELTGGSISKDGASAVRRTANLSCTVNGEEYDIEDLSMDFSLKTKVFIELGIRNDTDQYLEYPILWFPQGVFYITDFSANSSTSSGVNISLTLKDKMCRLNGDLGGLLPSTVQFDLMDTQLPSGEYVQQKVLFYNIILELVNHFGGEDINNIIIQDVPLRVRQVVKWDGKNNLYGYLFQDEGETQYIFYTQSGTVIDEDEDEEESEEHTPMAANEEVYETGADVGYVYRDFTPTSEIVGNAGQSITSVLDTIKNMLGNYEYFYDEMGIFHFREIKNYLNITQAQIVEEEMDNPGRRVRFNGGNFNLDNNSEKQYLIETTNEKTLYSFKDDTNITSITVTPQYGNIKNDYIIEGLKQGTSTDTKFLIRYHLAIDSKPEIAGTDPNGVPYYGAAFHNVVYYHDELENVHKLGILKNVDELPQVGNFNQLYAIEETEGEGETTTTVTNCYYWSGTTYKQLVYITVNEVGDEVEHPSRPIETYYPKDWRTFLYLYGLEANQYGTDPGPYFEELFAFWPQEYNLDPNNQQFYGEKEDELVQYRSLTTGNYFLDFIDANGSAFGDYSIEAIGRRQDVFHNEDINCLFVPEIPNIIFLNKDNPEDNWTENTSGVLTDDELNEQYAAIVGDISPTSDEVKQTLREVKMLKVQRQECVENNQPYTQVDQDLFSHLSIGGYKNSAYEAVRYELFAHTRYQKTVSLTTLPVFYLEPNSRVELNSKSVNVYGDFMVQNVSLTLGPGANMSVVLNEVAERL